MQVVIGGGPASAPLPVEWWVALTWFSILYYSPNFETCSVLSVALVLFRLYLLVLKKISEDIHSCETLDDIEVLFRGYPPDPPRKPFSWLQKIIPEEQDRLWRLLTRMDLSSLLQKFRPDFEGRETEQNWSKREQNVIRMRKELPELEPDIRSLWLSQIKSMLDGLLKTVNSLRTTVSTNGCLFFQDLAKECGPGIDSMVEILLQNFIKLCANTKPIARTNANDTVLAIIGHVSYHIRIMQHIHNACQDKNVQPRKFACEWLKKVVKRHPRSTIEHHGGLELIEKSIKLGLEDRDKNVREAMRPTYWNFARRWPERSEIMFSTLDKIKQDQLLADPSNPNPGPPAPSSQAPSAVIGSRSTVVVPPKSAVKDLGAQLVTTKAEQLSVEDPNAVTEKSTFEATAPANTSSSTSPPPKPSLKDVKAQMRKAHNSHENFDVAANKAPSEAHVAKSGTILTGPQKKPTLKEIKAKHAALIKAQDSSNDSNIAAPTAQIKALVVQKTTQTSNEDSVPAKDQAQNEAQLAKAGTLSAAPLRRKKARRARSGQNQRKEPEIEAQISTTPAETPEVEANPATIAEREDTDPTVAEIDVTIVPPAPLSGTSVPQTYTEVSESEEKRMKRAGFLAQALSRLSARTMDLECFRILQQRLYQDPNQPAWTALIEPLCAWLETPTMPTQTAHALDWQDVQFQALSTLRMILTNEPSANEYYPRILLTLTRANSWYTTQGPMVTGIRKGLNFVINHCNVLECLHTLCNLMQVERVESEDEIKLVSLGAMLHRIHSHPDQEAAFHQAMAAEQFIVTRLGNIGSTSLRSEIASIRKAAISFAQEFWHLVPEDDYWTLMETGDAKTRNLLKYYIARHLKIDDHIEL